VVTLLAAVNLAGIGAAILKILWVAIGLGLVIFFHELGHFAVAKWCNVLVERFSIGFGPVIWSRKKGETEYAISALPFGGYVKMLGQDDMDPSQLTSDQIAQNPRSYSSKTVLQRMAIISAGVIMNIITGLMFCAVAFGMGIEILPATVGTVHVGMPAWEAGLRPGDEIRKINDRDAESFKDIMIGVALSSGPVQLEGTHSDGSDFSIQIPPSNAGARRQIGVSPTNGLKLIDPRGSVGVTNPGFAAASAEPPFEAGDEIVQLDSQDLANFAQLQRQLAEKADKTVEFAVRRKDAKEGELTRISVKPQRFRRLGLRLEIGKIAAVVSGSPAELAGIKPGDRLARIDGKDIGAGIDPIMLPDYIWRRGQAKSEVELVVSREVKGGDAETVNLRVLPSDVPAWIEPPLMPGVPLSISSLGVAFHLIPTVVTVEDGSPAEKAGIKVNDLIRTVELVLPEGAPSDGLSKDDKVIKIECAKPADSKETGPKDPSKNWAYVFWTIQQASTRDVRLTVVDAAGESRTVTMTPTDVADWYLPIRGINLDQKTRRLKADGVVQAVGMGLRHTKNSIVDIYLTLRSLFSRQLSYKELHGPIGIAKAAYQVANEGIPDLLLFLGFLSINLAVLNFLPIPVLDGGHMVFLIWEGVTRKKPSEKVMIAATYFGMAFVLGLLGLVIYLDLFVHRGGN